MKRHLYAKHFKGTHRCPKCLLAFSRQVTLPRHLTIHHNIPFEYDDDNDNDKDGDKDDDNDKDDGDEK